MEIPWLNPDSTEFPDVRKALDEPDGLLALGGDLSVPRLVSAYHAGVFPWYEEAQPILWWSPNPRWVLFPDELYISKSLSKRIRQGRYKVTFDCKFDAVVIRCALPRSGEESTWITDEMRSAYNALHRAGLAHSVEVWHEDELVGGLYGVAMGSVFFGESMFSHKTDASKVGFCHLVEKLKSDDFTLIDCQVYTAHLESLGARAVSRKQFVDHLNRQIPDPYQSLWKN